LKLEIRISFFRSSWSIWKILSIDFKKPHVWVNNVLLRNCCMCKRLTSSKRNERFDKLPILPYTWHNTNIWWRIVRSNMSSQRYIDDSHYIILPQKWTAPKPAWSRGIQFTFGKRYHGDSSNGPSPRPFNKTSSLGNLTIIFSESITCTCT